MYPGYPGYPGYTPWCATAGCTRGTWGRAHQGPPSTSVRAKVLVPPARAERAPSSLSARASPGSRLLLVTTLPLEGKGGSSSHPLPGPTSLVDYGGDEPQSPCPGSGVPYHLHHSGRVGRRSLVPPEGGTRGSLQSAKRYAPWDPLEGDPKELSKEHLLGSSRPLTSLTFR